MVGLARSWNDVRLPNRVRRPWRIYEVFRIIRGVQHSQACLVFKLWNGTKLGGGGLRGLHVSCKCDVRAFHQHRWVCDLVCESGRCVVFGAGLNAVFELTFLYRTPSQLVGERVRGGKGEREARGGLRKRTVRGRPCQCMSR